MRSTLWKERRREQPKVEKLDDIEISVGTRRRGLASRTSDFQLDSAGLGARGVVWRESTGTYKRFYSNSLSKDDLSRCKRLVEAAGNAIIPFSVCNDDGRGSLIQLAQSPLQETEQYWPLERTKQFLKSSIRPV
jgi:hypothetical protein